MIYEEYFEGKLEQTVSFKRTLIKQTGDCETMILFYQRLTEHKRSSSLVSDEVFFESGIAIKMKDLYKESRSQLREENEVVLLSLSLTIFISPMIRPADL